MPSWRASEFRPARRTWPRFGGCRTLSLTRWYLNWVLPGTAAAAVAAAAAAVPASPPAGAPAACGWSGTSVSGLLGGDVRTGRVVVAERPTACRRRRDAAAATREDAVAAGRWVVRGRWRRADVAGEERRSLPVGVGASAADSVSSAVTVVDPLCRRLASISR